MASGSWQHKRQAIELEGLTLDSALSHSGATLAPLSLEERRLRYAAFLDEARQIAAELARQPVLAQSQFDSELEKLQFFSVPESCCNKVSNTG
jgi:hypothetical protein